MRRSIVAAAALAAILGSATPILAQAGPGVAPVTTVGNPSGTVGTPSGTIGSTATGEAPLKTAGTTAVGQTKPPGSAVGERRGTRPDLERQSDAIDHKINTGICSGCK